jgi:hypothetical protein
MPAAMNDRATVKALAITHLLVISLSRGGPSERNRVRSVGRAANSRDVPSPAALRWSLPC